MYKIIFVGFRSNVENLLIDYIYIQLGRIIWRIFCSKYWNSLVQNAWSKHWKTKHSLHMFEYENISGACVWHARHYYPSTKII